MEFKAFPEIIRLESQVTITEKLHGTNAQITVFEYTSTNGQSHEPRLGILAGSRTRYLTIEDDNYGFASWVNKNRDEIISKLGVGKHYGEWFGLGINSGYGSKKKQFALFDVRWADKPLPTDTIVVPVLYQGPWTHGVVAQTMSALKEKGSTVAPGFMKPEGIVIRFDRNGSMFKVVFEAEEIAWRVGKSKEFKVAQPDSPEVLALLQPVRLEKLLSRDERYLRDYPTSLPSIARDYVADLIKEGQMEETASEVTKALGKRVFPWIKEILLNMGYSA